jgi:cell division septum initiation protein DivIVA
VAGETPWPSTPTPTGGATATADGDRPLFATALRGYERNQVDDYLGRRDKELSGLRAELADLRAERDRAVTEAENAGKELREARAKSAHLEPAAKEDSFGFRAEKLLRMAEQEATDIRSSASRESATIIEKARTEAEAHRHEVEQTLITRASLLEQQSAKRSAALQEREQQIAEQLAAAREQAEQLQDNARRVAERLREESEEAAELTRQRADADARRRLDEAGKEISRLSGLQSDVRSELAQLAQLITTELATSRAQAAAKDGAGRNGATHNGAGQNGSAQNGSQTSGGSRDRK